MINLDLLKKLTRLANNNPNDNEANAAARRVCKMLEEANWSLSKGGTYNDLKRNIEPIWKSKPPTARSTQDIMNDFMRRYGFKEADFGSWVHEPKSAAYTQKEKRPLECTQCHAMVETNYVGNLYICYNCQWLNYQDRRDSGGF